MQAFYDAIMPRLQAIIDHCDTFPLDDLPDDVRNVLLLTFALLRGVVPGRGVASAAGARQRCCRPRDGVRTAALIDLRRRLIDIADVCRTSFGETSRLARRATDLSAAVSTGTGSLDEQMEQFFRVKQTLWAADCGRYGWPEAVGGLGGAAAAPGGRR